MDKSFLVLFFKKEPLAFLPGLAWWNALRFSTLRSLFRHPNIIDTHSTTYVRRFHIFILWLRTAMNALRKEQLPSEVQRRMRDRAVQYLFPDNDLKPLQPGSVLYTNRRGLVAHVSAAQHSGGRTDTRFWYGFRINHLDSIRRARSAFFVPCGFINDQKFIYFAFPCSANDRGATICGRPLLSVSGNSHFNVELTFCNEIFQLDVGDGGPPIDASPFVSPPQTIVASSM